MVQDGGQSPLVARPQGIERALDPCERARLGRCYLARGDEPLGEQWDDGERETERHEDGHRERRRQGGEELSHDALQQAEGQEDHHGRERGRRDGPDELLDRRADGLQTPAGQDEMTRDVLGDHHRVVDYESDRDGHRAQGHQVEGLANQAHHEHGDGQREWNRRRADRRDPPVTQEQQQDHHRERGADEHRVAHGADGVPDQRGLVVHRLQVHARRQRRGDRGYDALHAIGDSQRVAPDLARDVDQRRRLAVTGDDPDVVLRPDLHRSHVAYPQSVAQYHGADVLRRVGLLVRHDQILPVILRHPAYRLDRHRLPDGVGHVRVRHPLSHQARRVDDDLDLPDIRALHVHAPDPGDPGDQRLDLVAGPVV